MFKPNLSSKRALTLLLGALLVLGGCSSSSPDASQAGGKEAANSGGAVGKLFESSQPITVPDGTRIHVVLDQSLSSARSRAGDDFEASVSEPVVIGDKTVIPRGARVHGRVTDASESGRLHHVASLHLALRSVEVGGKSYAIDTSTVARTGQNHNKRNAEWIGGGAAAGALIGGIAGHGKGALIGAATGAGAGTAAAAATGKKDIVLPAETHLTFRLAQPLTITVKS